MSLSVFLETLSDLLLRVSYEANVNFLALRNLANNELFLLHYQNFKNI